MGQYNLSKAFVDFITSSEIGSTTCTYTRISNVYYIAFDVYTGTNIHTTATATINWTK